VFPGEGDVDALRYHAGGSTVVCPTARYRIVSEMQTSGVRRSVETKQYDPE
jgi:hypothetical protein